MSPPRRIFAYRRGEANPCWWITDHSARYFMRWGSHCLAGGQLEVVPMDELIIENHGLNCPELKHEFPLVQHARFHPVICE